MGKRVAVLGGGVAGMTAAHELMLRGFEVEVFEFKKIPGGKARSMPFEGSGKDGRPDLPGEHGFRLFPKFYKHVIDTMKRIPYGKQTVYDNLVEVPRLNISTETHPMVELVTKMELTPGNIKTVIHTLFDNGLGLTMEDIDQYTDKLWQVMTSCDERREEEYQRIAWWDFIEAAQHSPAFQKVFANITRTLVACKSTKANTKTVGTVAAQMTMDLLTPGTSFVRILNGPTNDRWIQPWLDYLRAKHVTYHLDAKVEKIDIRDGQVQKVIVTRDGVTYEVEADYYVAAFPVEVMATFITDEAADAHVDLDNIRRLSSAVDWMNGIQFYLKEDVPVTPGHVMYFDSPWSLTSISQKQFWPHVDLSQYGDGTVKGILSVDVSDWTTPGELHKKPAMECTAEEIREEVWYQLKKGLNVGTEILRDEVLHSSFLDTDIQFTNGGQNCVNIEPLLVNEVHTWPLRPYAYTSVSNLFLASDYVRTNTDLATMEGANEAARRAVNAILEASGVEAERCEVFEMYRYEAFHIDWLAPWHSNDRTRFRKDEPWDGRTAIGELFA
jgi:15-cis-phytoene desaturase